MPQFTRETGLSRNSATMSATYTGQSSPISGAPEPDDPEKARANRERVANDPEHRRGNWRSKLQPL